MTLHIGFCLQKARGRHARNVADTAASGSIPHHTHPHDVILQAGNWQQRGAAMLARNWKYSVRPKARTAAVTISFTSSFGVFVFGAFCATSTVAIAAEETSSAVPDSNLVMGLGYTWLKGNELVYDFAGKRISHLIWETAAPVLTMGFKAELVDNWTISAGAVTGFSGNSHMEDYDWKEPWGFDRGDWSSRYISPDTRLDRYISVDIAAGRDFAINDATTVNLHGGFRYTNVKWTAYGGTFTSSDGGFRNENIIFEPGERKISYEQRYPGVFLGAEATTKVGDWTLLGLLRGGFSVDASDIDHHWPAVLYKEAFGTQPFVLVGARADYQVNDRVSLFLAGNFDKYFREKGDVTRYDRSMKPVGANFYKKAAGMDLYAFTLSAGFKLTF